MALLMAAISLFAAEPSRPPGAGLYAVWVNDARAAQIDRLLPYLRGGQAVDNWNNVEPEPGRYDFSRLDQALLRLAARGRYCTIQVNANEHPDYLYQRVPLLGKFEAGPRNANPRGHLMYWHPEYVAAYQRLLRAFAAHFIASPNRRWILGVRLNWNALSTEHMDVPPAFRPPGYSAATKAVYQKTILATYLEAFAPPIRIFLRNGQADSVAPLLDAGKLALFHTSSEAQPRSAGVERQYRAFLKWCRTGLTVAYAEPWADAEGNHGGKRDPRWCSPAQWNYWTILANLHCGVSYIAMYGADLARAGDPEFKAAFDFADRYAGFHASPSASPGAWVAFREGEYLKGDYTFLMQRISGGEPVQNAGPPEQRFGAWARRLKRGERMVLRPDAAFARSLAAAHLQITYLGGPLRVAGTVLPAAHQRWVTRTLPARSFDRIEIEAPEGATLHMVELTRSAQTTRPRP